MLLSHHRTTLKPKHDDRDKHGRRCARSINQKASEGQRTVNMGKTLSSRFLRVCIQQNFYRMGSLNACAMSDLHLASGALGHHDMRRARANPCK